MTGLILPASVSSLRKPRSSALSGPSAHIAFLFPIIEIHNIETSNSTIPYVYSCRKYLDEYFIVLRGRFLYLSELQNISNVILTLCTRSSNTEPLQWQRSEAHSLPLDHNPAVPAASRIDVVSRRATAGEQTFAPAGSQSGGPGSVSHRRCEQKSYGVRSLGWI